MDHCLIVMQETYKTYLFIHVLWTTAGQAALLPLTIRKVLLTDMIRQAEQRGVQILALNGTDNHLHMLLQLHPAQNLAKVMKDLKEQSADWVNGMKLLEQPFEWQEGYLGYSVSPSQVKQVISYIAKQEEYHKTKSLDSELEVLTQIRWQE